MTSLSMLASEVLRLLTDGDGILQDDYYTGIKIPAVGEMWVKHIPLTKVIMLCTGAAHEVLVIPADDYALATHFIRHLTVSARSTVYTFNGAKFTKLTWQIDKPLPTVAGGRGSFFETVRLPEIPALVFDSGFVLEGIAYPPTPFPEVWEDDDIDPIAPGVMTAWELVDDR
jgi:hypothetical protein